MFNATPPAWETHASFVMAIVALVLAIATLPTAFQMFWGQPKLSVETDVIKQDGMALLRVKLSNNQIKSRFLANLGVMRAPVVISGSYEIFETNTHRQIGPFIRLLIATENENGKSVLLHPMLYATASIACFSEQSGCVLVDGDNSGPVISPGAYYARIRLLTSHTKTYEANKHFVVGTIAESVYWVEGLWAGRNV